MDENQVHTRSSSQDSPSTVITTPEIVAEDDVWASDNDDASLNRSNGQMADNNLLSDLPTIKRQHMTDGYREGLSIGKAKVMQSGFDAGYPIGVAIALRAGKILGFIEGILATKEISEQQKIGLRRTLEQAKQELGITTLLKDMTDQDVMSFENIPARITEVLSKWESAVFGAALKK